MGVGDQLQAGASVSPPEPRECGCAARAEAGWERSRLAAVAGTHRFVLLDYSAPMGTREMLLDGTGRMRLSPDVWRLLVRWLGRHDLLCELGPTEEP